MKLYFGDVVLHDDDIRLQRPRKWLNDIRFEFYYELLERKYKRRDSMLLRPSVAHLLQHGMLDVLEKSEIIDKIIVFCPLNDAGWISLELAFYIPNQSTLR